MDAIPGLRPAATMAAATPRAAAASGGFAVAAGGRAAAGMASAPVEMAGLLALQEAGGDEVRDRDARHRGRDLLDELAALQRELLAGAPDAARLTRLAELATGLPQAADPGLRDVVNAIALRARVEAARYQRA